MKNYEQIIKQLVETSPSWEKDGSGIRGRTIAPILSGLSSSGGIAEFIPQQFNQNNNETIQKSAQDPVADLIFGGGGSGGGTTLGPWDLVATQVSENQYTVKVRAGTLSGILPSNWDAEFTAGSTGIYYAKALISTDGNEITGVTILFNNAPPMVQSPMKFSIESSVEYLFGIFSEGITFRTIATGHISLFPKIWLTVPADPERQVGQSPYDQYYFLQ